MVRTRSLALAALVAAALAVLLPRSGSAATVSLSLDSVTSVGGGTLASFANTVTLTDGSSTWDTYQEFYSQDGGAYNSLPRVPVYGHHGAGTYHESFGFTWGTGHSMSLYVQDKGNNGGWALLTNTCDWST